MAYPDIAQPRQPLPVLVLGKCDLLKSAPPMPPGFHGSVIYRFRDGRLVLVEVGETLVPDGVKQ